MIREFQHNSIILILLIINMSACGYKKVHHKIPPRAKKGILDLTDWDFEKDGPIDLSGEYEFYWQQHLTPDEFKNSNIPEKSGFIKVHHSWNGYELNGMKLTGTGYATYRLTVLLKNQSHALALKFLDMGTAFTVFANGAKVLSVGKAGTTPETTVPRYFPQVIELLPVSNQIELIYHVSNFHHKRGGAWEVIILGAREQIKKLRERRLTFDLILFGSILIIGLYHIALFILRRNDQPAIYFGLFCILIAIRILTTVERYLLHLFPNISWELFVKIEYLSAYIALPVFALFIFSLFTQEFHKIALRSMILISLSISCVVLMTPVKIFSHTALVYQLFIVLCFIYGGFILTLAVIRKREGAIIILFGYFILFVTALNDILDANEFIQTGHFVQLGLFIFIFSQAFLLSFRYSKAFMILDLQRDELTKTNIKLKNEIIERKRTEQEKQDLQVRYARAQKMEAIGLIAGGVAHDLNNILSGIVTYPDLLLMDITRDSPLKEPLETIKDSGLKAAAVVQDLLTLARRGVMHFEVLNLNQIVLEYLRSPEHEKLKLDHPSVDIETKFEPGLFNIMGSPYHLNKTIMNLVANAAEAQPRGGIIIISTSNQYVDRHIMRYEEIKGGTYVVFKIEDKGTGIDPDGLKRIFEPFYTKKVMGRSGTGLGMAVVWGTIHDHQGYIDVESTDGKGTTFELYFQVTKEEAAEENKSLPIDKYIGNKESILVIDDVAQQRQIASRILKRLGYTVTTIACGEEAVKYLKNNTADLLVLDMIMEPGIDGLETYKRIINLHPQMKAIIASGFSETERVKQAQKLGVGSYIKKPYTFEKLGLAVRTELDK